MKDMQTEQLLCWSDMTDKERCTTSSSNEEEEAMTFSTMHLHEKLVLDCFANRKIFNVKKC